MKTALGIKGFALSEYAISANAILGIRDSGKTYTATKVAEELFDAGIPWVALDPIGVWHSLRVPGAGRGYPVVVAGGRLGDLPLNVKNAGAIVRAAMEAGVSLVIDLFSTDLSKADWRRIVRETVEILLHENADHGLRHIFIEEAAEFVPQRPRDGLVFDAVERLVRMGGNSKLGCTLINQRSADLNKSVLELCANVFVHRQKGKNTLLDLKKWFTLLDLTPAEEKKIADGLPNLKSGQCWALLNDLEKPYFLKVPEKNSQHPDRRAAAVPGAEKRKPVAADAFVAAMRQKLDKKDQPLPKPPAAVAFTLAPAKDFGKERAEALALGKVQGINLAYPRGFADGFEAAKGLIWTAVCDLSNRVGDEYRKRPFKMPKPVIPADLGAGAAGTPSKAPSKGQTSPNSTPESPSMGRAAAAQGEAPGLTKAERAVLRVLAHLPENEAPKKKVALMAGYSAGGGGFNNALSSLRTQGFLNTGEPLRATTIGILAAGTAPPLPSGADLLAYWCSHKALGKAARDVLTVLVKALPGSLTKEEVAERTEYQVGGGGFNNALSTLRTLELISGRGDLRAAEEFGE